jgi:PKD repeat protein
LSWHITSGGLQQLTVPSDPVSTTWEWDQISPVEQGEELSTADIDRDGDDDLLRGSIWLRNDAGSWTPFTLFDTALAPDRNRLADVNGDDRLDAIVGFEAVSKLAWYEQGAIATDMWSEHTVAVDFFAPMSVDAADLDGDGDIDIVAGEHNLFNPLGSRLYVYENNGNGSAWTPHEVYTGDEHHDGAQLVDIDTDGDLDIISIGWTHDDVLLYENRSPGGGVFPPVNLPPVASLVATPTMGAVPLTVSFDASASSDPDGDALTFHWGFGDGMNGVGTGSTPSRTYTEVGSYLVTLLVGDGTDFSQAQVRVLVHEPIPPPNRPPVAALTGVPLNGLAPLEVQFDASESSDPDGDALSYHWAFGDYTDVVNTGPTPAYVYTEPGNYLVTLLVHDGTDFSQAQVQVTVDAPTAASDLVAHWTLDEASGYTVQDEVGSYDGRLVGGPTWQPDGGRIGGALAFDGVDDRVDVGSFEVRGDGLTVALWLRPDGFASREARLVSKATGVQEQDHYWMVSLYGAALRFRLKTDGLTSTLLADDDVLLAGKWLHVACTYDKNEMRIYGNGTLLVSAAKSGEVDVSATAAVALGNQPVGAGDRAFDGQLDDVRIYHRALSETEIAALANPGAAQAADDQGLDAVTSHRIPEHAALHPSVPNPFNPSTTIRYDLSRPDNVMVAIFDVRGGLIRTLVNARQAAGANSVIWDGRDNRGVRVHSGVYFVRLRTPQFEQARKIVLIE